MGDELEYLKLEISSIAARVEQLFPGIDQRFALILYRDDGDRYVTRNFDFTDFHDVFKKNWPLVPKCQNSTYFLKESYFESSKSLPVNKTYGKTADGIAIVQGTIIRNARVVPVI